MGNTELKLRKNLGVNNAQFWYLNCQIDLQKIKRIFEKLTEQPFSPKSHSLQPKAVGLVSMQKCIPFAQSCNTRL